MSEPTKQSTPEQSGPRIYETETPAKSSTPRGVYDAPSRSLPIGLIIGIVVVVLIALYLLYQFVF